MESEEIRKKVCPQHRVPAPRRDPTTAQRGDFWLLGFPSGPVRPSLGNQPGHPELPQGTHIDAALSADTRSTRKRPCTRTPDLKPSTEPDLQAAGLQETPNSQSKKNIFLVHILCRAYCDDPIIARLPMLSSTPTSHSSTEPDLQAAGLQEAPNSQSEETFI
ncbi:hypothetical protein GWI33_018494 [Rhynchophorus ferrugineus]|uniref:Uncharacterized protein n=1 Tax=Rhynchophorus ferrugineus TaxID=354439 RepID=A0A834M1E9_RHYFE|nr:hypothetical protein GWI33_018494 [Rhynchophorus ferrugineus]